MKNFISNISNQEFPSNEKISAKSLRPALLTTIQKDHPHFQNTDCLSLSELNVYREKYIADYLVKEIGELSELEDTVLHSMQNKNTLTDKIEDAEGPLTFGQRMADNVA